MRAQKGVGKDIFIKLSDKKYDPGEKVGNSSTVPLADAGTTALQDFDTLSWQPGETGFDRAVPFELLTGVLPDDASFVTLPGDSGMNDSVVA